jgi:hypothetical protein
LAAWNRVRPSWTRWFMLPEASTINSTLRSLDAGSARTDAKASISNVSATMRPHKLPPVLVDIGAILLLAMIPSCSEAELADLRSDGHQVPTQVTGARNRMSDFADPMLNLDLSPAGRLQSSRWTLSRRRSHL